jgi:Flp pilus assembly protein TadG
MRSAAGVLFRKRGRPAPARPGRAAGRSRAGAALTVEFLLVLPVVVGLMFAIIEFGMLLAAAQKVKTATDVACRVGTLPAASPDQLEAAVRQAATRALVSRRLAEAHELQFEPGQYSGDPVAVEIRVPMKAAAPDLLRMFGFGLKGRWLAARTVLRKE